ncbi:MAG: hypothetical protein GF350_12365 [Chitinivibrionales bacterium]|nr:hypothetical protein [Chitinivibrionales bacterium]
MKRKKGYPILLGITVLFTLISVYFLITSIHSPSGASIARQMTLILAPLLCAGATCVIRKRFFTEPGT